MISYKEINEIYKKALREQEQKIKEEAGGLIDKLNKRILQEAKAGCGCIEHTNFLKVIRVLRDYYKGQGFKVEMKRNTLIITWGDNDRHREIATLS